MQSPPPPPRRRQPVRSINPFAPIRHWGTCTLDVRGWVPKKQMNKLRLCEFYSVNQLPNADKGKGVKKSENFANVICVWSVAPFPPSFGRRKRNESSTRDPGRSGADQETVEEWMGKEDMLLNRGRPFLSQEVKVLVQRSSYLTETVLSNNHAMLPNEITTELPKKACQT